MMNHPVKLLLLSLVLLCRPEAQAQTSTFPASQTHSFADIKEAFFHPDLHPNFISIAAHRGYFKDYPENSLQAVQAAIAGNYSLVEIDLKTTKDGVVVLAHDYDFGRLTTCPGSNNCPTGQYFINDFTLDEIRNTYQIKLKGHDGNPTTYNIPTLAEVLDQCKGKILVDFDKMESDYNNDYGVQATPFFDKVYKAVLEKKMFDQVIFKARAGGRPGSGFGWSPTKLDDHFKAAGYTDWKTNVLLTPIYFRDNALPEHPDRVATAAEFKANIKSYKDANILLVGAELVYSSADDPLLQDPYTYLTDQHLQVIQFASYPENPAGNYSPTTFSFTDHVDQEPNQQLSWDWLLDGNQPKLPTTIITDRLEILKQFIGLLGKQTY